VELYLKKWFFQSFLLDEKEDICYSDNGQLNTKVIGVLLLEKNLLEEEKL
jgi:hypothetical protein